MTKEQRLNSVHRLKALPHLAISVFFGGLGFFIANQFTSDFFSALMFAWIIFCIVQIGVSWYVFISTSTKQTQLLAAIEDPGRLALFTVILLSTFGGLLSVFILLATTKNEIDHRWISVALGMSGMFLSWFLVHTIYTSRYAHLYYGLSAKQGLVFPGNHAPDFVDFAYYAFVIGMTFQVSDVTITSKKIRRIALGHSLISFVFNTCIVALTISAIAGLVW